MLGFLNTPLRYAVVQEIVSCGLYRHWEVELMDGGTARFKLVANWGWFHWCGHVYVTTSLRSHNRAWILILDNNSSLVNSASNRQEWKHGAFKASNEVKVTHCRSPYSHSVVYGRDERNAVEE